MEEDVPEFELGDTIYIKGGVRDTTRGRIYYMDDSLIRILPIGTSDRLVDIPIVDGQLDPSLEIENFFLVDKTAKQAFVEQINAQVGQEAETFDANGAPGPKYKILSVNAEEDSLVLEDETGAQKPLSFKIDGISSGIQRDEPFAVLRPRQPPAVVKENAANAAAAAAADEEEKEAESDEFTFIEEIESEMQGLKELPKTQRFYPTLVQQTDMFQEMLAALELHSQKNPKLQKNIRKVVEQCTMLRNDLVTYDKVGEPLSKPKSTSYATLSELLDKVDVPLARPVIDAKRLVYVDMRSDQPILDRDVVVEVFEETLRDSTSQTDKPPSRRRLSNVGGASGIQGPDALPNWYVTWDTLFKDYMRTWISDTPGDVTSFRGEKEFIRAPVPPDTVSGYPRFIDVMPNDLKKSDWPPITEDYIGTTRQTPLRAIGPRFGRLREKEGLRRIESGDEGVIINQLLFPLSAEQSLGTTKTGKLAKDIAFSHAAHVSWHDTLYDVGGVPDVATAGGIISIGVGGNTEGNIGIDDWLKAQPLLKGGLGDMVSELKNLGLAECELRADQQAVLIEKINQYRALVKQTITTIREDSAKAIAGLRLETSTFLQGEPLQELLNTIAAEPLIGLRLAEVKARTPAYKDSDIALVAGVCAQMTDLFMTTVAGQPGPLARERHRRVRDQFLAALRSALAKIEKGQMRGEIPVPNKCPHVASYAGIKKAKVTAGEKMQLLSRFLAKFQSGREDNWVSCSACPQHLMCYHEVMLLREHMHPREKDAIHKELILAFSGGVFQGKYICKNCGQPISDMDLDQNMEFDDEGRPMMGRAVLVDKDAIDEEELEQLIGGPVGSQGELTFPSELQTLIYKTARQIFDSVGIYATIESFQKIVERVELDIQRQPSREDYARILKARGAAGALDYDVLINRVLISSAGIHCLIEIQTNIPGYIMRYKLPGCKAGFTGTPIGADSDRTGIDYIACAIASIKKNEPPWNLTGYFREAEKRRNETIMAGLNKILSDSLKTASVQQLLLIKRAYLQKIYGTAASSDRVSEAVPAGFKPVPYYISEKEAAETVVVAAAATEDESVRGWIQMAHRTAKQHGTFVAGSPFSEVSCCFRPLSGTGGGSFLDEKATMPTLPLPLPPRGPVGSHLGVHYTARRQVVVSGEVPDTLLYRVFLNVCYTGPREGLPHEPGYTNKCVHCGFVFPENPFIEKSAPPISADAKTNTEMMKEYISDMEATIEKGKAALETQKVPTNKAAFEALLDKTHQVYHIDIPEREAPVAGINLLQRCRSIDPEPFGGWREVITQTIAAVGELPPKAEDIQIAEAYGPISNLASRIFEEFEQRMGAASTTTLRSVFNTGPSEVAETVLSYILVPLQRSRSKFQRNALRVQKFYDLGSGTAEDIERILRQRLEYIGEIQGKIKGFVSAKMEWLIQQLSAVLPIVKNELRPSFLNGGRIGLPYLVAVMVGGILLEFINPNNLPPQQLRADAEAIPTTVDAAAKAPIQILALCLKQIQMEGLGYTEQEIRDLVARYTESEKMAVIHKFDRLTPEEKAVELMNKKLGTGDWAVGGTKVIRLYNEDQYERERVQRAERGLEGLGYGATQGVGADEAGADEGVDYVQTAEEDF